ncbi:Putative endoplasmic reticulum oxidoreductin 1, ERO1-like superfamily [Septoria linicola]|uniref:Endoplasmic reticulum oxidoreductin 1, ERO1-like superfamily n=1 Tax=Septoria linicola TaxID=215465 RepID=A0A9Q9AU36_9PEZI|nr:putative endoplasmic reticulum oxidoreductin 1, ERO1-like superfamily [Septoria linicola]USW54804.1 Putative endoplasmic reticulum oxidoreductin 1, ERO1-like superfamily [Septoria linicola]
MRGQRHSLGLAAAALLSLSLCTTTGLCETPSPASAATPPDVCALEPKAKVSDACASYHDLDSLNSRLHPYVRNLANNTDFFSYYRLNLYNKVCPFWNDDNGLCGNRACAVITLDNEEDVPEIWRAAELSKLEGPKAQHPGRKQQKERDSPLMGQLGESVGESCVVEYDDECDERDYCVPEDESAAGKGDYVSLVDNPERFTGYSGEGAHQVWETIYRENCFSKPSLGLSESSSSSSSVASGGFSMDQAQAALQLKRVIKNHDRQLAASSGRAQDALDFEDECLEKRVFYRVISGMHASISTHLCYDYLNQQTGEWGPNLTCYKERLHNRPDRISNIYFNFALMSRAVGKLRDYVQDYVFCTGDTLQDARTKKMITTLANAIPPGSQIFDESVMFQDQSADGISLKEDFRNRFRNVSRVMDCVGCDKCRLWGKIQTNGFGTALKVLFEFGNGHEGDAKPLLRRTELVALVNTLDKISSALKHLEHFKAMVEAENSGKSAAEVENTPRPSAKVEPSHAVPNFDDLEDLDEHRDDKGARKQQPTVGDLFWEELDNVWTAYKFVLWSWSQIPFMMPTIVYSEFLRLSDFWLGRPVRPRMWEIKAPTLENIRSYKRDEL